MPYRLLDSTLALPAALLVASLAGMTPGVAAQQHLNLSVPVTTADVPPARSQSVLEQPVTPPAVVTDDLDTGMRLRPQLPDDAGHVPGDAGYIDRDSVPMVLQKKF